MKKSVLALILTTFFTKVEPNQLIVIEVNRSIKTQQ